MNWRSLMCQKHWRMIAAPRERCSRLAQSFLLSAKMKNPKAKLKNIIPISSFTRRVSELRLAMSLLYAAILLRALQTKQQESFSNKYSYKICINFIHFLSSSSFARTQSCTEHAMSSHMHTHQPEQTEQNGSERERKNEAEWRKKWP